MNFITTFLAVFTATLMGQISAWIFKKEIEHRLDKGYERIKNKIIGGKNKMGKLIIDIERGSNKGYIVTWYKKTVTGLQKLTGVEPEKETLTFTNTKELSEWIEKNI